GRAQDVRQPGTTCPLGDGEHPADATDAPVKRKLADRRVLGKAAVRHLSRSSEERERNRNVEAGALLAKLGRGEIDDQAAVRPEQLGGANRAGDAFLRLLTCAVGEPDDRK